MSEQWVEVPIKPFSEYYLISNTGKVFSKHCNRVLSPKLNPGGYEHITLCAHGQQHRILIHRLVALAFIENPENKPTVNHINENKRDNRAENLEWATIREQNIHGTRIERAMTIIRLPKSMTTPNRICATERRHPYIEMVSFGVSLIRKKRRRLQPGSAKGK